MARGPGQAVTLEAFTPVKGKQTLYERIVDQIRTMITSSQLKPGDRLPSERELAERLGVSRVPIREAMKGLAAMGLLEVRHGSGIFVAHGAMDTAIDRLASALVSERHALDNLLQVRRLLEVEGAGWAAMEVDSDEALRLKRLVEQMDEYAQAPEPDWEALRMCDQEFHLCIARASRNTILLRIFEAIQDVYTQQLETTLSVPGRLKESLPEHHRILDAILANDVEEARAAMLAHLEGVERATHSRLGTEDD